MKEIIEKLIEEHRLIEKMAGSFVAMARDRARSLSPSRDLPEMLALIREYVGRYHHEKEEKILVPAVAASEIPAHSAPMRLILREHRENHLLLQKTGTLLSPDNLVPPDAAAYIKAYCRNLWEHIDKEDSVFFPELEHRIRNQVAAEALDQFHKIERAFPHIGRIELAARRLVKRHPPIDEIEGYIRGDGCINCRHYGVECDGIEREWWTEHEWDAFHDRPM